MSKRIGKTILRSRLSRLRAYIEKAQGEVVPGSVIAVCLAEALYQIEAIECEDSIYDKK